MLLKAVFYIFTIILFLLPFNKSIGQGCCSGGTGSPIAGGASQGVLQANQMELSAAYQYLFSDKFKTLGRDTSKLFDKIYSNYLYGRLGYGLTEKLTLSVEAGYFINKTQIELNKVDTIHSAGFGDLIIFPRYQLFNKKTADHRTEMVVGLGCKIPIGKYNDSTLVYTNPTNGKEYFAPLPPTIQPTTGSLDFVFYGFVLHDFTKRKFKLFSNLLYIKKGWNPLGQKFGDYMVLGLFASRTVFNKLGLNLQLKAEHIAKMKAAKNIDMVALYNVYTESTGSTKLFIVPQVSFSQNNFTYFLLSEFPLYQYVNGTQVVSQIQATAGISYRFFTKQPSCEVQIN